MTSMSFTDKLRVLLDLTTSSALFIGIVLFMILITYLLINTTDKNIKKKRKIYISVYIIILGTIIFFYHSSLGKMLDSMMENVFVLIYFPNIAVYLTAIITTNIILWTSILNVKITKLIKVIDCIVFTVLHYLLILILNVITTEKLDVFNQTSLYSDNNLVALIELSSVVFIIWIIFLVVYNLFFNYLNKHKEPIKEKVIVKEKVAYLPKNINIIPAPIAVELPKVITNNDTSIYDQMLTLDDYKKVIKILREENKNTKVTKVKKEKLAKQEQFVQEKLELDLPIIELETTLKNITEKSQNKTTSVIELTQPIPKMEEVVLERLPDVSNEIEPTIIPIIENKTTIETKKAENSKFLELQALYKSI